MIGLLALLDLHDLAWTVQVAAATSWLEAAPGAERWLDAADGDDAAAWWAAGARVSAQLAPPSAGG